MLKGNEVIYQIFVRNYSFEGTFEKVQEDLPRLKELGVDIIYLLPIHEIGIKERKGTFGSPYAIKDYYSISSDLGTLDDFKSLVNEAHGLGMKIILDMVFNHTSPDSVIMDQHPEYYFYKNGKPGNRVGDWSDIIDLDTHREDTQNYLVNVLKYWASLGVDGFRFDVASMVDFAIFKKARDILGKEIIFIGESVDPGFAKYLIQIKDYYTPDIEMFPVFDGLYNYSWFRVFGQFIKKEVSYQELLNAINEDEKLLSGRGLRINCMENHDNDRVAYYLEDKNLELVANLFATIKGPLFLYMGQEYGIKHKPALFEKDPVIWKKNNRVLEIYKKAIKIKHLQ